MRYIELKHHVSYGLVGGRSVFLDLRRDRYLGLDPAAEDAFAALRSAAEPVVPKGAARDALLATELFRESSFRGRLAAAAVPRPRASINDTPLPRPGWLAPVRVWSAVARARKRRARTPLFEIVDTLREARLAGLPQGDPGLAERAATEFLTVRPLVPIARNCLLDCLALLDLMDPAAGHATLVFGVRLDPFGAHCWLQTDELLLTDTHDLVGNFTPVLAL